MTFSKAIDNIEKLVEKGYQYILGGRIKNEKHDIKEKILGLNIKENGKGYLTNTELSHDEIVEKWEGFYADGTIDIKQGTYGDPSGRYNGASVTHFDLSQNRGTLTTTDSGGTKTTAIYTAPDVDMSYAQGSYTIRNLDYSGNFTSQQTTRNYGTRVFHLDILNQNGYKVPAYVTFKVTATNKQYIDGIKGSSGVWSSWNVPCGSINISGAVDVSNLYRDGGCYKRVITSGSNDITLTASGSNYYEFTINPFKVEALISGSGIVK